MIVAAAIIQNGVVYVGIPKVERHHHLIHYIASKIGIKPVNGEQGFMDDEGIFHNRQSAAQHVLKCNQPIVKCPTGRDFNPNRLFSEDIF